MRCGGEGGVSAGEWCVYGNVLGMLWYAGVVVWCGGLMGYVFLGGGVSGGEWCVYVNVMGM